MLADTDTVFGQLAVERGHVTPEQIDQAREDQKALAARGLRQNLAQILYSKNLISKDQVHELRQAVAVHTGEARLVGDYEVVSKIGEGGMGAVYKARRIGTEQLVALKVLPPALATEELVARFRREADIVNRLDHRNIVRFVEFGYDQKHNCHFCALELVDGEDLSKKVKRSGRLTEAEALGITLQIALALEHARRQGLVHRDVKPANIMVKPDGTAKLLDLGLARPTDMAATRYTQTGVLVGSVHYMSPEQAQGVRDLDTRSDIYSLGATLYFMVTGQVPFEGTTALEVLRKHLLEEARPPQEINPELSDDICRIIRVMMAKKREDRYQNPVELLRELAKFVTDQMPEAVTRSLHGISALGAADEKVASPPRQPVLAPPSNSGPTGPREVQSDWTSGSDEVSKLTRAWRALPTWAKVAATGGLAIVAIFIGLGVRSNSRNRGASKPQSPSSSPKAAKANAPSLSPVQKGLVLMQNGNHAKALPLFQEAARENAEDYDSRFHVGVCYSKLGMPEKAILAYNVAASLNPGSAAVHNNLGWDYINLGSYEEAAQAFQKATKLMPDYATAQCGLGSAYSNLKKHQQAVACFEKAIEIRPDYADAYAGLGTALGNLERYAKAIEPYTKAVALKPDYAEAHHGLGLAYSILNRDQEAILSFQKALAAKPEYPEAYRHLGLAYLDLNNCEAAAKAFENAIKLRPNYADVHGDLGFAYVKLGRHKEALHALEKALNYVPNDPLVHLNMGEAYLHLREPSKAVGALSRAVKLSPKMPVAHYELGFALGVLGRHEEAVDELRKAVAMRPDYLDAHYMLGLECNRIQKYQDAATALKNAIRLKPEYAEAHYALGVSCRYLRQYPEAAQALENAIRLKPDHFEAHNELGRTYRRLGQTQKAVKALQVAVSLRPDHPEVRCELGWVCFFGGMYEDAAASFGKASGLKPDLAEPYAGIGMAHASRDRFDEAVTAFKNCIRLNPAAVEIYYELGLAYFYLRRADQAIEACKQAIKRRPEYVGAHNLLAVSYLLKGDKASAEAEQRVLLKLDQEVAGIVSKSIRTWEQEKDTALVDAWRRGLALSEIKLKIRNLVANGLYREALGFLTNHPSFRRYRDSPELKALHDDLKAKAAAKRERHRAD